MSLHLVTGHKGEAHITAEDQGAFNAAVFGNVDAILSIGEKFKASAIAADTVRIYDGELVMQGRHIRLARDTYEEVKIDNGTQGMNRNDLIVVRYTKNAGLGHETAEFAVLKGTETAGTATDPTPTTGDILSESCLLHEMPLYRVKLTGITVAAVEVLVDTIETIAEYRGTSLSVSRGGTGRKTHTSNSVLVGSGTNALKNIASKIGAFFSNGSGTEPKFGTLPVNCGGTGADTVAAARNNLGLGNTSGALPVANGGTGATTAAQALKNLGITVTASAINLLSGVTSNIQTQLNGKAASNHEHSADEITSGTLNALRLPYFGPGGGDYGGLVNGVYQIMKFNLDARGRINSATAYPLPKASKDTDGYLGAVDFKKLAYIPYNSFYYEITGSNAAFTISNLAGDPSTDFGLYVAATKFYYNDRSGYKEVVPDSITLGTNSVTFKFTSSTVASGGRLYAVSNFTGSWAAIM